MSWCPLSSGFKREHGYTPSVARVGAAGHNEAIGLTIKSHTAYLLYLHGSDLLSTRLIVTK